MSPSIETRENREFAAEIKFLISPGLAADIRDWARARLVADPNANGESGDGYQISSLYFDTRQFDVFHRNGSYGRSKYRIRRYGRSDVACLERKLKTRGLLAKRRSPVELEELPRLNNGDPEPGWAGQWFHQRLQARRLDPVCRIQYRRTARVAMTRNGPIRLTLDDAICAWRLAGLDFAGGGDGSRLLDNQVVLEMKYRREMPALFKMLVEEFTLNPQSVSKYRLAAMALDLVTEPGSAARSEASTLNCIYA